MRSGVGIGIVAGLLVSTAILPSAATEDERPALVPDQVVVIFRNAIPPGFDVDAASYGAVIDRSDGLRFVTIKTNAVGKTLDDMRQRPDVLDAYQARYLYPLMIPNGPYFGSQWGASAIGLPGAWGATVGSHSVKVAVLDTGIDMTHPDLTANVQLGDASCGPNKNFANSATIDYPGPNVAGIVGAVIDNGVGVAGTSQSCIMDVKVLENCELKRLLNTCESPSTGQRAALGVEWAVTHGADIVSMSFRTMIPDPALAAALGSAWGAGLVLVAAAGNEECPTGGENVAFPASHPQVMAVASLDDASSISYFSSCGSNVKVAAPGRAIWSTHTPGGGYASYTGTSFAAPFVSGVASLLLSAFPTLTNEQVHCLVEGTADDLGPAGWDPVFGFGRLNATFALTAAIDPSGVGC
ncbi:MAG: S8 family serine peptidase [Methanobacteriota archaeon]